MSRRKFLIAGGTVAAALAAGAYSYRDFRSRHVDRRASRYIAFGGAHKEVSELPESSSYDVCIIGSGPAGSILGKDLAAAGVRTVILEAGHNRQVMQKDARYELMTHFHNGGSIDYPFSAAHIMAPGGTSAIWTGRCNRLYPGDFAPNACTPETGAWPIKYEELESYYCRAESTLRVVGEPNGDGAPRSKPLPPSVRPLPDNAAIRKIMALAGVTVVESPSSEFDDGGPFRAARDMLPLFTAHPSATLVLGATAHRLHTDAAGRTTAVTVMNPDRMARTVTARVFVLAGGAVETARRLLLCRSERFPAGLANESGLVGVGFHEHPDLQLVGQIRVPNVIAELPKTGQPVRTFQYYDSMKQEGFGSAVFNATAVRSDEQRGGGFMDMQLRLVALAEMSCSSDNRIELATDSTLVDPFGDPNVELMYGFGKRDQRTLDKCRQMMTGMYARLGAEHVTELPMTWGHHHMSTVRMGVDPRKSVVDASLKTHGHDNLYLLTSGTFVTSGAMGPRLTIAALAHRLAEKLQQRLKNGELPEAVPARQAA